MKLTYTKDNCGNDILIDEDKELELTMEWELPYIEECIDLLEPKESVLEIGFGMGNSATKICLNPGVKNYTVIECNPVVWEKFEEWKTEIQTKTNVDISLIKGRWQDILQTLGKYDSIYFDDYNGETSRALDSRVHKFMYEILQEHVNLGSRICYYSTTNTNIFNNINCIAFECYNYNIKIPNNCKYANGEEMYIPIYTVISEPDYDLKNKMFGNDYEKNKIVEEENTNIVKEYYIKPKINIL